MDDQIPIFDVDTHFTEPHDLWTSRAPEKDKDKDKVLRVRQNDGYDSWCAGDTQLGLIGTTVSNRDMEKVSHESCSIAGEMLASIAGRVSRLFVAETRGVYHPLGRSGGGQRDRCHSQ